MQRLIGRSNLPFVENVNRYFSVRYNLISKNKESNTSIYPTPTFLQKGGGIDCA